MDDRFRIVLTTAGSDEQAETLARALVERRLAACVNILHRACSFFRWEGRIEREEEAVLVIKTTASSVSRVRETIRELHTYDVPEVLSIPIAEGDPDYLSWLEQQVEDDAGRA